MKYWIGGRENKNKKSNKDWNRCGEEDWIWLEYR